MNNALTQDFGKPKNNLLLCFQSGQKFFENKDSKNHKT